jgi:hypothetical protein
MANIGSLKKGDQVQILIGRDTVNGTYSHQAPNGKAYVHVEIQGNKKGYERSYDKVWKTGEAETTFEVSNIPNENGEVVIPTKSLIKTRKEFNINERFDFLAQLTRMVINRTAVSLIVTGKGGLGKTHTVKEQIEIKRLIENEDWVHIKGYATARGLYRQLFEANGKLCVFDDCDSILEDKIAINILKSALDSYDVRMIHWLSQSFDESLPASFEFTGQVIFISNKDMMSINQAIISRGMSVDLTMSTDDIILRMSNILPKIKPLVSLEKKLQCLELIKENVQYCHDLNMRTLIKIIDIRTDAENEDNWRSLAEYSITNTIS